MRILDIQNLQLSHNNFDISNNDLNLENDAWYIETSINLYFNFSYKTRFASELEDMVYLLTQMCETEPVSSQISLEELKKARWFSFLGKGNKETANAYTFEFVVAQTIKQLSKTKRNRQPRLACTWIHSPEN